MRIISHRGYWKDPSEKNSMVAFERSFNLGFGTETDIRDCLQNLVISHDIPKGEETDFSDLLSLLRQKQNTNPLILALNIKADGLAKFIGKQLRNYPNLEYFAFDMSIPDMPSYFSEGIPTFARMSEVERLPAWLDRCSGVWLDAFDSEWYDINDLSRILNLGKQICIVSPELHHRPYRAAWSRLTPLAKNGGLILCTDLPEKAVEFFTLSRELV